MGDAHTNIAVYTPRPDISTYMEAMSYSNPYLKKLTREEAMHLGKIAKIFIAYPCDTHKYFRKACFISKCIFKFKVP